MENMIALYLRSVTDLLSFHLVTNWLAIELLSQQKNNSFLFWDDVANNSETLQSWWRWGWRRRSSTSTWADCWHMRSDTPSGQPMTMVNTREKHFPKLELVSFGKICLPSKYQYREWRRGKVNDWSLRTIIKASHNTQTIMQTNNFAIFNWFSKIFNLDWARSF